MTSIPFTRRRKTHTYANPRFKDVDVEYVFKSKDDPAEVIQILYKGVDVVPLFPFFQEFPDLDELEVFLADRHSAYPEPVTKGE